MGLRVIAGRPVEEPAAKDMSAADILSEQIDLLREEQFRRAGGDLDALAQMAGAAKTISELVQVRDFRA